MVLCLVTSFVLMPWIVIFSVWGNILIARLDNSATCEYDQQASSYQMLYMISNYCLVFAYSMFLFAVQRGMIRFYTQVYYVASDDRSNHQRPDDPNANVNLCLGWKWSEVTHALAYSFFVIRVGKIGSIEEREYLQTERNRVKFLRMNEAITSVKFEKNLCFIIEDNNDLSESLLNKSGCEKKSIFKYTSCTICLSDFDQGDAVKILPDCNHTFHDSCLQTWLIKRFACPNCNLEIQTRNFAAISEV